MDINDELIEYITAMNLDESEIDIYPNKIESRLCLLKCSLLSLKEVTSLFQKSRSLLNENVPHMRPIVNFYQDEQLEIVEIIDAKTHLLPSAINANSYKDQITHVQTKWAELNKLLSNES